MYRTEYPCLFRFRKDGHNHPLVPGQGRGALVREFEDEVGCLRLGHFRRRDPQSMGIFGSPNGDLFRVGAGLRVVEPEKAQAVSIRIRGFAGVQADPASGLNREGVRLTDDRDRRMVRFWNSSLQRHRVTLLPSKLRVYFSTARPYALGT